ncbi:MAG: molybdate transporter permease [Rhizorhabdus sp.]|nr:molybdate transporter permease [Rhizorhabdus sp.]
MLKERIGIGRGTTVLEWLGFTDEGVTAILLTLKVALVGVIASLPLGIGLAYLLARGNFWGKSLLDGLIHLPLVLPPVVTGYLLLLAFMPTGPLGAILQDWFGVSILFRWTGAAVAAAIMGLPLMVRTIRLSIEALDPRLEIAARSLGGSRWYVFRTITLPLVFSGISAGAVLAFARSLGEFGATITFVSNIPGETQTLPIAIYSLLQVPGAENRVMHLSIFAILLSLAALFLSEWFTRRRLL